MIHKTVRFMMSALCLGGILVLLQACPGGKNYTLSLSVSPEGAGSIQKQPDAPVYQAGSIVTLTATPSAGWRFDHWEGPVAEPAPALTSITLNSNVALVAHFSESASPGEASAALELSGAGTFAENTVLSIPGGSNLSVRQETSIGALEASDLQQGAMLVLRDRALSEIAPVGFANWIWAFDAFIEQEGAENEFLFSSLTDALVVDPEYIAEGALFTASVGAFGIVPGTEVAMYKLEQPDPQTWRRIARTAVQPNGEISFSINATGRYAIGRSPYVETPAAPDLGTTPVYDCVLETEAPMNRVKVIEESTAEVFNAWLFTDIAPGQMPETTDWIAYNGDEPCMGRLENYGKRFRVRSPYANAFSAEYGLQEEKLDRAAMTGPYLVDMNGNPAAAPLENPYTQCDRIFAAEVKMLVLSRAGDYTSFKNEVVQPLRTAYDTGGEITSNVRVSWFKKMEEGYYAELFVRTEECTSNVANNTAITHEEGVSIVQMKGRLLYVVDWRGGGPYVAVYTTVAHNTAVGLRFYDPYWNLEGGILDEHSLGGPNNMILKFVDMEYDCVHDTLWVIKADENGIFNLFRYDKPIYNFGDRPPDARIDFPTFALRQLCVDPLYDRLFVHTSGSPDEDGDGLRIFAYASGIPRLENRVTHVSFMHPGEQEPKMLLFDHMLPMGNALYLINGVSGNDDGLSVFSYPLSNGDFGARFKAWASFGAERTAPISKGVFSRTNNILYTGTDSDWNADTAVYAIDAPASWQSQWIIDPETENGYWTADRPNYRIIRWANPGTIWDLDVVEGDAEILAVCDNPSLNQATILLFNNANTAAGLLQPFYRLEVGHGTQHVELINPPKPQ